MRNGLPAARSVPSAQGAHRKGDDQHDERDGRHAHPALRQHEVDPPPGRLDLEQQRLRERTGTGGVGFLHGERTRIVVVHQRPPERGRRLAIGSRRHRWRGGGCGPADAGGHLRSASLAVNKADADSAGSFAEALQQSRRPGGGQLRCWRSAGWAWPPSCSACSSSPSRYAPWRWERIGGRQTAPHQPAVGGLAGVPRERRLQEADGHRERPQSLGGDGPGRAKPVQRINVANRSKCWEDRAVALIVEVSSNRETWTQVARRDEEFRRWTAKFRRRATRYVRLKAIKPSNLHLKSNPSTLRRPLRATGDSGERAAGLVSVRRVPRKGCCQITGAREDSLGCSRRARRPLCAAGRAHAQAACDTDRFPNPACGGEVCTERRACPRAIPPTAFGGPGTDGWCAADGGVADDSKCKCRGMGAVCDSCPSLPDSRRAPAAAAPALAGTGGSGRLGSAGASGGASAGEVAAVATSRAGPRWAARRACCWCWRPSSVAARQQQDAWLTSQQRPPLDIVACNGTLAVLGSELGGSLSCGRQLSASSW